MTSELKLKYLTYISGNLSYLGPENVDYKRIRDIVYDGSYKRYNIENYNHLTDRLNERYNIKLYYISNYFRNIKISQILDPLVDISYSKV